MIEKIKVKLEYGMVSLVGVHGTPPLSHGNYFSLGGYYIVNMWYENLNHLNIQKEYLDGIKFGDGHVILIDEDIPDDFLNDKPCFTGSGGISKEAQKAIYKYMYPQFESLDCMCNYEADYKSFSPNSYRTSKAGLSLKSGTCSCCDREIKMNGDDEVTPEVFNQLVEIYNNFESKRPTSFMMKNIVVDGEVKMFAEQLEPDEALDTRYANKVRDNLYGGALKQSEETI